MAMYLLSMMKIRDGKYCRGCAYWDDGCCGWTSGNGMPPCDLWVNVEEDNDGEMEKG